ncbi:hypothetical protein [Klebsiella variicola]|uniref:hypothetical protein n=1 Tax=Klebsiella variicola TaxID=244366 RepID=UPI001432C61A|nr:hypothetical protein [Klebsiella variicola]MCH6139120.1 hypothetical protein [Klebsiella variicola]MCH6174051.1 hypothetical protein [Klebsiella variicola]
MVDKDSFLNKLNQRAQDELLAQEKAKAEQQKLHAEANKKIETYISAINTLISDITDWISGGPFELITKQKEIHEQVSSKVGKVRYVVNQLYLVYKGHKINFNPTGCLNKSYNGRIEIVLESLKLEQVYHSMIFAPDPDGNYQWHFVDSHKPLLITGDVFRDFTLKTLNIK